jgi:hypothetical protein
MSYKRFLFVILLVPFLASCSNESKTDKGVRITRSELQEEWPLTVDSGYVYCGEFGKSAIFSHNGTEYALNGTAEVAAEKEAFPDYKEIRPIWADDPGMAGKKSLGPLIDLALKQCD